MVWFGRVLQELKQLYHSLTPSTSVIDVCARLSLPGSDRHVGQVWCYSGRRRRVGTPDPAAGASFADLANTEVFPIGRIEASLQRR